MEQDLDRGDKAAPGMSLLGLRMLVTAHRASHCQHCVQDPAVVPDGGHEKERKQGCGTPTAFQPAFFLILGGFCVFGDLGGVLIPLPLPIPVWCPSVSAPVRDKSAHRIKQCGRLGI